MSIRASGVLLHLTSLPGMYGVGDLGPAAYHFSDYLAEMGQLYWQMLPLGPTSPALGNSPYAGFSAFAGNALLISPELLVQDGLLDEKTLGAPWKQSGRAEYEAVDKHRSPLLSLAFANAGDVFAEPKFVEFMEQHEEWLEDWALYSTLKTRFQGAPWWLWPREFRFRDASALNAWRDEGAAPILREKFTQYLFASQWNALKKHCRKQGIRLVGDLPIYVGRDSADVWSRPELYKLDDELLPCAVAGVPPDYFSETGQLWGNPVYDWDKHQDEQFAWWRARVGHALDVFDRVRIDHFRGFTACWEIPAGAPTAVNGTWAPAPGRQLFNALARAFPELPIIAEDLGVITDDVRALKEQFDLPGMNILQFAFGDERGKHAPHFHEINSIVYTGSHDNNTSRGWFESESTPEERGNVAQTLGAMPKPTTVHKDFIRLAMGSVADLAIAPMQDILGLGAKARMNTPSTPTGNWEWRLTPKQLSVQKTAWFKEMGAFFGRV